MPQSCRTLRSNASCRRSGCPASRHDSPPAPYSIWDRSRDAALPSTSFRVRRSVRPTISSMVLKPIPESILLTSSARNLQYLTTSSGLESNLFLLSGSWVAMPTGHVFVWHFLHMTHPMATIGAVASPNPSAPSSAATTMSRAVLI